VVFFFFFFFSSFFFFFFFFLRLLREPATPGCLSHHAALFPCQEALRPPPEAQLQQAAGLLAG
jgi:hypothetical protein